ncbi:efflux RND transporter periplasmic adaptor subunit [Chitinophaga nivalis]|uniref:Efflux RND transporter periplasmic adaptor subunit n=1 Tax=Chitinophaga nivalis TaxID=2991709 RepID=A0ABT3IWD3_9BACT|nr:efflux RND transporter periplasmic adaptor subunit [Chitinophaga nivalis]MCW3462030.1 efflux RND transporter periplasmic adaptor subunit [Chitinophaga nivalis]MCW3488278.1 efflux RND transporter periplasmic adaptor subunit [Chitinophaga nivalis]
MRKYKRIIIILMVILALIAIWYFFIRKKPVPVTFERTQAVYGPIATTVTATGTIQPVDTVAVGTQVSGTLKYLYVDFNSKVKKGELLGELDKVLFQTQVDQYNANLQVAKSNLEYQQNNFRRQELLFKTGAISRADYDVATNQLNQAKANVASVNAQLQSALKNLSFTEITSPIAGVVLNRNVSVGQTVAASFNTPTLFVIAKDITKMQVEANVDEADIGNVADSQRVTFTVDAYLEDVFSGRVQEIRLQPSVSSNVVTYNTIINAPNDKMKLKPGMTANATIYTAEKDSTLLLPVKALKFRPDSVQLKDYVIQYAVRRTPGTRKDTTGKFKSVERIGSSNYVWLLRGDTLVQKHIRTGLNDNTHIEVLSGLTTQDIVIMSVLTGDAAVAQTGTKSPFLPKMGGGRRR